MSIYNDVLLSVIKLAEQTQPYSRIVVGSLPPDSGISMTWASASTEIYFDKNYSCDFQLVLNAKHPDQQTAADALGTIHIQLTKIRDYPNNAGFQITSIESLNPPTLIGREENKQYLYGSSLRVKFYLRGDSNWANC